LKINLGEETKSKRLPHHREAQTSLKGDTTRKKEKKEDRNGMSITTTQSTFTSGKSAG